jgi:predicted dehydrogenase
MARVAAKAQLGVPAVADWRALKGEVDLVSICSPASTHGPIVRGFLEAGAHVLVEKPIATDLQEAEELILLAQRSGRVLTVGHQERFVFAKSGLLDGRHPPIAIECVRAGPWTGRSTDVGVVLDLMIHDLDTVMSFVNSPVKEIRAAGLPVLSDKVDIANARVEFESGCVANFTASRVSTERVRKLRFFQPHQYISIDYGRQDVLVFTVGSNQGVPSVNPEIKVFKPPIASEEPLRAEIRSFLRAVRTREKPVVPFEDGRRALAVALEVIAGIREHTAKLKLS